MNLASFDLDYLELSKLAADEPEKFWDFHAHQVDWMQPYTSVLEDKFSHQPKWFVNGKTNLCYNCLDKHVIEGHGSDVAVIHESFLYDSHVSYTYSQMLDKVSHLSGVLRHCAGVKSSDRVLLYMPMIPETLMAMLACTRIGATYCNVFGGFPAKELAVRIRHMEPKLIITSNVGYTKDGAAVNYKQIVEQALHGLQQDANMVQHCLVFNRPPHTEPTMTDPRDLDWIRLVAEVEPVTEPEPVSSNHPVFVIYTSGSTGEPKGLVIPTAGCIVVNKFNGKFGLGVEPQWTFGVLSDFGWILGQSMMTYTPLTNRCKTIIFEGPFIYTKGQSSLLKAFEKHQVNIFITPPTIMKNLKMNMPNVGKISIPSLKFLGIGGELVSPQLLSWLETTFGQIIYNIWGQTEIAGAGALPCLGFGDAMRNSCRTGIHFRMIPGLSPVVIDKTTGLELPDNCEGHLLLQLPIFPTLALTLFKDEHRFYDTYFRNYPGYYDTMDVVIKSEDGFIRILARDDDVIHVAAARVCAGALEEICHRNQFVEDVVMVALEDEMNGQVPFGFIVPKPDKSVSDEDLIRRLKQDVYEYFESVAQFNKAIVVNELPHSKNGKICRNLLRKMLNGEKFQLSPLVENRHVFEIIRRQLTDAGYTPSEPTN